MKFLHYLNLALMGSTVLMFAFSMILDCGGAAILLTMILAFYQVVIGFFTYLFNLANLWLAGYLLGVALFFCLLERGIVNLWLMPSLLALFFTYNLYTITKTIEP